MEQKELTIAEVRDLINPENFIVAKFPAISKNEKIIRNVVGAFIIELNPSVEELSDIKTAISEAVTNSVVHGYKKEGGEIELTIKTTSNLVYLKLEDFGVGIKNIEEARQPFFTTGDGGERSGMGFTVMETFMDEVEVTNSENNSGLVVEMLKIIGGERERG